MEKQQGDYTLEAGFIHAKLLGHMLNHKGECLPMISPLDIQLNCDNKTMVQPDVIIVCDRDKIINRCIYGAPDFVIEVLSKPTRRKDMVVKLNKYMNAKVPVQIWNGLSDFTYLSNINQPNTPVSDSTFYTVRLHFAFDTCKL